MKQTGPTWKQLGKTRTEEPVVTGLCSVQYPPAPSCFTGFQSRRALKTLGRPLSPCSDSIKRAAHYTKAVMCCNMDRRLILCHPSQKHYGNVNGVRVRDEFSAVEASPHRRGGCFLITVSTARGFISSWDTCCV